MNLVPSEYNKEIEVLAPDIYGVGRMGPESDVRRTLRSSQTEYSNSVGDAIRTGPFGAAGYIFGGDRSALTWSHMDELLMSFAAAGTPYGITTPNTEAYIEFVPKTESYEVPRDPFTLMRIVGFSFNKQLEIVNSFENNTMQVKIADQSTYGLRFYDNLNAGPKGSYLFPTFTNFTNRAGLALKPEWNNMTYLTQFQIKPGDFYLYGRAAPQGPYLEGGEYQMVIFNINSLKK